MAWWIRARFGLFVHWGLYARLGRGEFAMNHERIPVREYEKLASDWKPRPGAAREWARLARQAGARYMVFTTKHHEGFCLWDTRQTGFNAMRLGPRRDLVREYVDACRAEGLKVGLYYSLMDWHHPDGARCVRDAKARRRFLDFTHGCVRELCTNYGRIDVLWYDIRWPLYAENGWECDRLNAMVRSLQPHIVLNDRSGAPGDFATPEGVANPAPRGRPWECCMTTNGAWGWQPCPDEDWLGVRQILRLLRICAAYQGNLLLNVGPLPDGRVPPEAEARLRAVGRWLARHGEAVYGPSDWIGGSVEKEINTGAWTLKGKTAYFWCTRWPGRELTIGSFRTRVKRASLLATGRPVAFRQRGERLTLQGLPLRGPDREAGVAVIRLECESKPRQVLGMGCVLNPGTERWRRTNALRAAPGLLA